MILGATAVILVVVPTLVSGVNNFLPDMRDGFLSVFGINEMETELGNVKIEANLMVQVGHAYCSSKRLCCLMTWHTPDVNRVT